MATLNVGDIFKQLLNPPKPTDGGSTTPRAERVEGESKPNVLQSIFSSAIEGGAAKAFNFFKASNVGQALEQSAIQQQARAVATNPTTWMIMGVAFLGILLFAFSRR